MAGPTRWSWVVGSVLAAIVTTGCGYSLAGRGSFLPSHIRTIGIPLFVNNTPVFELEQILTDRVRSEFIGRGRYQVLVDQTGVDAILRGEITSVSIAPATFTTQQQASRYVVTVSAKIEFYDVKTGKAIWQNPGLIFRDEYDVQTGSVVDATSFFGQQSNAVERVATDFARTVVSSILEAF